MQFSCPLVKGAFLKRLNPFLVEIEIKDKITQAHLPNSGRLKELLSPGRTVFLQKIQKPRRRTNHDLLLVDVGHCLVSADSRIVNKLVCEALVANQLPEFSGYNQIQPEPTFQNCRLDFLLTGKHQKCLMEVKSITLVENGVALFPDAPTQRATKHLKCLMQAKKQGLRAAILFVIQRPDAHSFSFNEVADPVFAATIQKAHNHEVEVYALTCQVSKSGIRLDKKVKVNFS